MIIFFRIFVFIMICRHLVGAICVVIQLSRSLIGFSNVRIVFTDVEWQFDWSHVRNQIALAETYLYVVYAFLVF